MAGNAIQQFTRWRGLARRAVQPCASRFSLFSFAIFFDSSKHIWAQQPAMPMVGFVRSRSLDGSARHAVAFPRGCMKPRGGLFHFVPAAGRSTFWQARVPKGTGLVMPSSTAFCSYISAVTVLLQCASGNTVLAQMGQATTATASANDRGDACHQSIEKVIDLCMIRGLNNIGRVNCDCVQDGRKWTCTGTAACTK
jgi:hypothetical protein